MSRLCRICALLFLLAGTLATAQEWVEVKSPHFSVATDAGEKRGREVATRFEQMRAAFGLLFQRMKVNIPVPLQIVAFRRGKDLRDFAPIFNGKTVTLSGYFQPGQDRNFIVVDLSSDNWGIVFHEYAHLLINGNVPETPAWYDEGFAEYCSTLVVGNKQIEFGRMSAGRTQTLRDSNWMHVEDLFSVSHASREYNEGDRRSVFYAESTLVVNYLMGKRKNRELAAYLRLAQEEHVPVVQAMKRAFGMEPKEFDRALRDFFRGGTYSFFVMPAPAGFAAGPFTARDMDEVEWQTILADLHFHSPDHRNAGIAEFRRILEKQPENTAANRGVGYAYLMQNDFDHAAEHFRIAARDSQDPRIHYLNAVLASRRALKSRLAGDELANVRKELNTALALDPDLADAYNLLAFVEASSDNLDAALANLRKAIDLDPRNDNYKANLARYHMAAQHWDEAEKILNALLACDNPDVQREAGNALSEIASFKFAAQHGQAPRDTSAAAQSEALAPPLSAPREPGPKRSEGAGQGGNVPATATEPQPEEAPAITPPPPLQSIRFLKAKLISVDCSQPPGGVLNVRAGGKDLVMYTTDTRRTLLIGVDTFSCDWKNRNVSINYRLKPDGRGEIVSLEVD